MEHREAMGAEIGSSAICRFLHKVGFSREVIKLVALQRDKEIGTQSLSDVSIFELKMLIFLEGMATVSGEDQCSHRNSLFKESTF